jgi:hypothetical protein
VIKTKLIITSVIVLFSFAQVKADPKTDSGPYSKKDQTTEMGAQTQEYKNTMADTDACIRSGGRADTSGNKCKGSYTPENEAAVNAAGLQKQTALDAAAKLFAGLKARCPAGDMESAVCLQEKISGIMQAAMKAQQAVGGATGVAGDALLQKYLKDHPTEKSILEEAMSLTGLSVGQLSNIPQG